MMNYNLKEVIAELHQQYAVDGGMYFFNKEQAPTQTPFQKSEMFYNRINILWQLIDIAAINRTAIEKELNTLEPLLKDYKVVLFLKDYRLTSIEAYRKACDMVELKPII